MSYTDYLNRYKINSPVVIDTQMRLPDASSYTWRRKLAVTSVNQRTNHIINNVQDPNPAPTLNSKRVMAYPGTGFGGKVQDASSYTMSLGASAIAQDFFGGPKIQTVPINSQGSCLTRPPASQVVYQNSNADGFPYGLNTGYQTATLNGSGVCTAQFRPLTESQFVDTHPDIKTKKMGILPVGSRTGDLNVDTNAGAQGTIVAVNTYTTGNVKNSNGVVIPPATQPYNSYSAPPYNPAKAVFVTSPTGPQVGGGTYPGSRAPKVGGATPEVKRTITHRGWANPTRQPYPHPRVPPRGAPAQLKINDATHYKS